MLRSQWDRSRAGAPARRQMPMAAMLAMVMAVGFAGCGSDESTTSTGPVKHAQLDFRFAPYSPHVHGYHSEVHTLSQSELALYAEQADAATRPADAEFIWLPIADGADAESFSRHNTRDIEGRLHLLVSNRPHEIMLGRDDPTGPWGLKDASVTTDSMGKPAISFVMDKAGAKRLGLLTVALTNATLAIVVDGEVRSAPLIRETISREGIITGDFSRKEVREMANCLRAGMKR